MPITVDYPLVSRASDGVLDEARDVRWPPTDRESVGASNVRLHR